MRCPIRDGGAIVIGVEQERDEFIPIGLGPTDRDSFNQDDVSSYINEYADPYAEIKVSRVTHEGKDFVVIQVKEFDEIPVICKKDSAGRLRRGAVYTRPRRKFESAEVPSQAEMREILDMAVEKGIRAFEARVARAGLGPAPARPRPRFVPREDVAREHFDEQSLSFVEAERLRKIHSGAYWAVTIRPTDFEDARIPTLGECDEIVSKSVVLLRGWDYPHVHQDRTSWGDDWVESWADSAGIIEYWRLYQSGQFIHHFACREDYELGEQEIRRYGLPRFPPERYLSILNALYRVTEIFEFAARLASKTVLSPEAQISIVLIGTRGRMLVYLKAGRDISMPPICQVEQISFKKTYPHATLMGAAAELALIAATHIFERFNWRPVPRSLLAADQARFLAREL